MLELYFYKIINFFDLYLVCHLSPVYKLNIQKYLNVFCGFFVFCFILILFTFSGQTLRFNQYFRQKIPFFKKVSKQ